MLSFRPLSEIDPASVRRVVVYRVGSLGDSVIGIPAMRAVAERFPGAHRVLVTATRADRRKVVLEAVLDGTGTIHEYLTYRRGARRPRELWRLRNRLRALDADLLVYLAEPSSLFSVIRQVAFFAACGIRRFAGVPVSRDLRRYRELPAGDGFEHESSRLLRTLEPTGLAEDPAPLAVDLRLGDRERERAAALLAGWPGRDRFVACAVSTLTPVKDWGARRWQSLLERLGALQPGLGLAFVGSQGDFDYAHRLGAAWPGPVLNLCGATTPRECAALLERADLFLGNDGGPMHLAAAVDTPCVAVFSARSLPGVWFPLGDGHVPIYHRTECQGCHLDVCVRHASKCIRSIRVDEVLDAVTARLAPPTAGELE